MHLHSNAYIDSTDCGNITRYINHSCKPNCVVKLIEVNNYRRIAIYSGEKSISILIMN